MKARLDVGYPWEAEVREHLEPVADLDVDSVRVLPRLSDEGYDELLSRNVAYLDLLDSSANNAIVECVVRNTPLLVNRIAPVVEYLGADYPLYFESREEAEAKAADFDLVLEAHEYLKSLPEDRYTVRGFLDAVVSSEVYQALAGKGRAPGRIAETAGRSST